jgi:hypothetical protein
VGKHTRAHVVTVTGRVYHVDLAESEHGTTLQIKHDGVLVYTDEMMPVDPDPKDLNAAISAAVYLCLESVPAVCDRLIVWCGGINYAVQYTIMNGRAYHAITWNHPDSGWLQHDMGDTAYAGFQESLAAGVAWIVQKVRSER